MVYLLYSPKANGWLTRSSTYSTDLKEAWVGDRAEALRICKLHRDQAGRNMIPVRQEDINAIG